MRKSTKILACFLSITVPITSFASERRPAVASEVLVLNPASLRENLIHGGLTVLAAANRVHKSKENLNIARARLLPSLNLGVLLGTFSNPTFLLSAVEYVFPFLLPSRWFDVGQAKNLAEAERVGFLLTELNIYSSLYSMYFQILSDFESRHFLGQDLRDSILIENLVERALEEGRATEAELQLARSQTADSRIRLFRFEELLVEEIAALRESLALPLEKEIRLEKVGISVPALEDLHPADGILLAKRDAPEYQQLNFLIEAAKAERWSKVFGFFSSISAGNSVSGLNNGDASFAFRDQMNRGSFFFSFDYFPSLELSNRNLEELQIRQKELDGEIVRSVEALSGRVRYVLDRKEQANASEALLNKVFENERRRFSVGETTLQSLLEIQAKARQASLESLRADTDLSLLRVALHRIVRSDEFTQIKGCEVLPREEKKPRWRWPWESDDEETLCDADAVAKRFGSGN